MGTKQIIITKMKINQYGISDEWCGQHVRFMYLDNETDGFVELENENFEEETVESTESTESTVEYDEYSIYLIVCISILLYSFYLSIIYALGESFCLLL